MNIYFLIVLLVTGALTITTDIAIKKIRNRHLCALGTAGILGYGVGMALGSIPWTPRIVLNPLVGLGIGFILYLARAWKAGDAKLFVTYSLLLVPSAANQSVVPLPCLALFLNTFLVSLLGLVPSLGNDIIKNKTTFFKQLISKKTMLYFGRTIMIIASITWIVPPALKLLPLPPNPFLNVVILFISYAVIFQGISVIRYKLLILVLGIGGLMLRYCTMPRFFEPGNIIAFMRITLLYSIGFYILNAAIGLQSKKPVRVPLAPFMFLGALLTYAGFPETLFKMFR
ncbi:MAG: hypothetical protein ABH865_03230 [Candidatus Omnitrophota bacterium]